MIIFVSVLRLNEMLLKSAPIVTNTTEKQISLGPAQTGYT